jgi:hypothetical protein
MTTTPRSTSAASPKSTTPAAKRAPRKPQPTRAQAAKDAAAANAALLEATRRELAAKQKAETAALESERAAQVAARTANKAAETANTEANELQQLLGTSAPVAAPVTTAAPAPAPAAAPAISFPNSPVSPIAWTPRVSASTSASYPPAPAYGYSGGSTTGYVPPSRGSGRVVNVAPAPLDPDDDNNLWGSLRWLLAFAGLLIGGVFARFTWGFFVWIFGNPTGWVQTMLVVIWFIIWIGLGFTGGGRFGRYMGNRRRY